MVKKNFYFVQQSNWVKHLWQLLGPFYQRFFEGLLNFYTVLGPEICSSPLGQTRPTTQYIYRTFPTVKYTTLGNPDHPTLVVSAKDVKEVVAEEEDVHHHPVNHLHCLVLVVVLVQAGPVLEQVANVLLLLVPDAQSHLPLHQGYVGVVDEPLLVEDHLHVQGSRIPHHVVPLVHVHGGDLVGSELVEEELLKPPVLVGPAVVVLLLERAADELLDEGHILLSEPMLLEERQEVVLLDDVDEDLEAAQLVGPLRLRSCLRHKGLPEVGEGTVPKVVAESSQHHAQPVLLGGTARPLQHQVLEELAGQVHHPQAVLHPAVLRPWEDVVGAAKLSQAGPNNCMQPMLLCIFSGRPFEDTFKSAQWRKVKQVQPMRLYIFSSTQFEDTLENAQWAKQLQPM